MKGIFKALADKLASRIRSEHDDIHEYHEARIEQLENDMMEAAQAFDELFTAYEALRAHVAQIYMVTEAAAEYFGSQQQYMHAQEPRDPLFDFPSVSGSNKGDLN